MRKYLISASYAVTAALALSGCALMGISHLSEESIQSIQDGVTADFGSQVDDVTVWNSNYSENLGSDNINIRLSVSSEEQISAELYDQIYERVHESFPNNMLYISYELTDELEDIIKEGLDAELESAFPGSKITDSYLEEEYWGYGLPYEYKARISLDESQLSAEQFREISELHSYANWTGADVSGYTLKLEDYSGTVQDTLNSLDGLELTKMYNDAGEHTGAYCMDLGDGTPLLMNFYEIPYPIYFDRSTCE